MESLDKRKFGVLARFKSQIPGEKDEVLTSQSTAAIPDPDRLRPGGVKRIKINPLETTSSPYR
jgi:hypothetical protein